MTQRLQSFSTSRPVAVLMVFLAAIVFGALSYRRLPLTLMPELSYPTLTVRTEYPGAAPEEVENDVSRRIEAELGVVSGLQRMSSISRAGVSDIVLEFSWDSDMSDAVQATLEKLDLVFLPEQAERPLILRFDPNLDPVMEISLSGKGERFEGDEGLRRLRRIAELQVKKALEPIHGVAAVRVRGGLEEQIKVQLDAAAMQRSGLSIQTVIDRLQRENINVAGGTLKEGRTEYMVRTLNEYQNLDEIRQTVIAILDGRPIRVADVGEVLFGHRDREILTRTRGENSVQLDLFKEGDANMVAMSNAVRDRMGDLDLEEEMLRARGEYEPPPRRGIWQRWPPWRRDGSRKAGLALEMFRNEGAVVQVVADRSEFIEASIREVRNTAILGGMLAVVVLYFFLRNLATTLIVAVSIPISLLIGFAPLNLLGVSLNIMSLGGLALGVGMLVDSSIVALESIFRCREEGDDLRMAAVRGVREVRAAIIASTLTSIAVFLPMVFVEGVAGQAFGDLGLAVVISLLASMVVALSFVPMLASRRGWGVPSQEGFIDRLRKPASWRRFQSDREHLRRWRMEKDARRRVVSVLAISGLCIRLVVSLVLEIASKLVLALVLGLVALVARLVAPIVGR
ncbi:MAG: efflux RND transporter permease subunit, partial [Myxococcota bacterium]